MGQLALIHDYLLVLRGAERTFAAMADMWPEAPIFTLLYDAEGTNGRFAGRAVTTSPLQSLGSDQRNFRVLLPLFPTALRALSLEGHECVVSSSSAFAHGVRVPRGIPHVCYCHSPFRYAWQGGEPPFEIPAALRPALDLVLRRHRAFDRHAARRVDLFVANSQLTKDRIRRFWGRESVVVHPPVDVERFRRGEPDDYVLFVGELVRHKRADVAIAAAAAAGRRIKVVGDGPELGRLRAAPTGHAEFLGRVSDAQLAELYAHAAALIVPNVEEFGIVAVEAQAAGRPVVALDAGGARETVIPGRTGILVAPDDPRSLARGLQDDLERFDSREIQAHAQQFSRQVFETQMIEIVDQARRAARSLAPGQRLTKTPSNWRYSPVRRSRRTGSKLRSAKPSSSRRQTISASKD
jgi:glycosyltransferase involved in cell wall biosynthesis